MATQCTSFQHIIDFSQDLLILQQQYREIYEIKVNTDGSVTIRTTEIFGNGRDRVEVRGDIKDFKKPNALQNNLIVQYK